MSNLDLKITEEATLELYQRIEALERENIELKAEISTLKAQARLRP